MSKICIHDHNWLNIKKLAMQRWMEVASQAIPCVNFVAHDFMGTMSYIHTCRLNIILVIYVEGNTFNF